MDNNAKKLLKDIFESIVRIETYIGSPKVFSNYNANIMMQNAVERNLEIIGEAMKNLLALIPEINITNSRRIIDARNKIAHGYDEVENVQVWNIIINHLPLLKQEVETILGE